MNTMKSLKILSLFFVLFVFSAHTGFAQSKGAELTDEQKEAMAQNVEAFMEVLDLSEVQERKFEAITKKYGTQMIALKDSGSSRYQMYRKAKSIQKNRNAEMKQLLSKKQYEIYLEKQEEMQKKMKEKRG